MRFGTGRGNLGDVRVKSGNLWGGLGRVGGPSGSSKTGRATLGEIRGTLGRFGTGRGTLGVVCDG